MLKNYDKYRHLILQFAKMVKIKVTYRTNPSDGSWIPSVRKISIDKDLSEEEEIATVLHELGHALDDFSISDVKLKNKIDVAYGKFYKKDVYVSDQRKSIVIKCEERAWTYGKAIANLLGIPTGKWYDKIARKALRSYKKE